MDTLTRLRRTREILTPEGAWTQGSYARLEPLILTLGMQTDPFLAAFAAAPIAKGKCFCLVGAWAKAAGQDASCVRQDEVGAALNDCLPEEFRYPLPATGCCFANPIGFNDTIGRTQAEVLAVLDCAIAKEEAKNA